MTLNKVFKVVSLEEAGLQPEWKHDYYLILGVVIFLDFLLCHSGPQMGEHHPVSDDDILQRNTDLQTQKKN